MKREALRETVVNSANVCTVDTKMAEKAKKSQDAADNAQNEDCHMTSVKPNSKRKRKQVLTLRNFDGEQPESKKLGSSSADVSNPVKGNVSTSGVCGDMKTDIKSNRGDTKRDDIKTDTKTIKPDDDVIILDDVKSQAKKSDRDDISDVSLLTDITPDAIAQAEIVSRGITSDITPKSVATVDKLDITADSSTPLVIAPKYSSIICELCSRKFVDELDLDTHYATHYKGTGPCHVCSECGQQFSKRHHLLHHVRVRMHFEKSYVCSICKASPSGVYDIFKGRLIIYDHLKTVHNLMSESSIEECIINYISAAAHNKMNKLNVMKLMDDQRNVGSMGSGSNFNNSHPGRMSSATASTLEVVDSDSSDQATNPQEAAPANSFSHPDYGLIYTCYICEQGFQLTRDLMKHSTIHFSGKRQTCRICTESFDKVDSLKSHMAKHRGPSQWIPDHLSRYIKVHAGTVKSFICNICGLRSARVDFLTKHLLKHKNTYTGIAAEKEKLAKVICKTKSGIREVSGSQDNTSNTTVQGTSSPRPSSDSNNSQDDDFDICPELLDIPTFDCNWCGCKCTDELQLDDHYFIHTKFDKNIQVFYPCHDCPKRFGSENHLSHHQRIWGHHTLKVLSTNKT